MASVVNNLRVNGKEVKKILFNGKVLKEFYYNGTLIWKNANPFLFVNSLENTNLNNYGSDTIIFENFGASTDFTGSYNIVENAEEEKPNLVRGQMVVETTEGDN